MIEAAAKILLTPLNWLIIIGAVSLLSAALNSFVPIRLLLKSVFLLIPTYVLYNLFVITYSSLGLKNVPEERWGMFFVIGTPVLYFFASLIFLNKEKLKPQPTNNQWRVLAALEALLIAACAWLPGSSLFRP